MANKPNNPSLWSRAKSLARQKFDVYPSAYANGWAAKWYKGKGGTWRKAEYGMEVMGDGGTPNNPGFNALPEEVQEKIIANMGYGGGYYNSMMASGGEKMPPEIARARFAAAGNMDQMADYGYAFGGYIPEMMYGGMDYMANGGYTVSRSSDRKGKTHKVTGPDGTVKYFGDSKLGQHPKDPERKAAFYARHKKNLAGNPFFRAFARETWADGGQIDEMAYGGYMPEMGFGGYHNPYMAGGGSTYSNGVFYQTGGEAPRIEDYPDYTSWRSDFEAYQMAVNDSMAAQVASKGPGVSRVNEDDESYDADGNYYPGKEAQRYLDALSDSNNPEHLDALDVANRDNYAMMFPSMRIVDAPQSTPKSLPGKKAAQISSIIKSTTVSANKPQIVTNNSDEPMWTQGSNLDEIVIKAKKKPAATSANNDSFYKNAQNLGYGTNKANAELRQDNKGLSSRAVPGRYGDIKPLTRGVNPNQQAFSDAILDFFMKDVPLNLASAAGVGLMGRAAKFLPASKNLPNIVKTRKIASAIENARLLGASKVAPKVQQYVPRVAEASANTGRFQYPTYTNKLMKNLQNVRWNNSSLTDKLSVARNVSKMKKAYGGLVVGEEMEVTPEQLEQLRAQGIQFEII